MKRLLIAAALFCVAGLPAFASTSNVTATLTDPDGTVWGNCTWTATATSPVPPTIAGTPVPDASLRANGSCNSSGVLTATILDTSSIQQTGMTWAFTIQPNASVAPSVVSGVAVVGATVNLSSTLSASLKMLRFAAGPNAYGYADIEINSSSIGNTYFNTGTLCSATGGVRQLSNAGWQCGGGGSGGGASFPSTSGVVCNTSTTASANCSSSDLANLATNPLPVAAEWPFNEGTGTVAHDITGNGHDATFCTSATPTWGNNGIQFLAALNLQQCAATNLTSFGSIAIAYEIFANPTTTGITSPVGPYNNLPVLFGPAAATGGVEIYGAGVATPQGSGAFNPGIYSVGTGGTGAGFISNTNNGFGQRHVLIVTPATPIDQYYIDGVPITAAGGSALADVLTTSVYQFGFAVSAATRFFGTIQYAVATAVGSPITPAQAITETNYIQAKLNARALTPYALATTKTPTVVFAGDSLWAGREGTQVWTNLISLNNTYASPLSNHGISGEMASDICNLAESTWLPSVSSSAKTYVLFDGGINDLGKGATPASIWASHVCAANKARAAGAIPIASTIISSTGNGGDAAIAPVNALIRAGWKQAGFAALLDNAELSEFAAGGSTNLTYYNADGTHLTGLSACTNTTGYGLFCMGASKIINTLDGSSNENPDQVTATTFVPTDANNVVIHTPAALATYQLVDCSWLTASPRNGEKKETNNSAFNITVSMTASQVLSGSTTILPGVTAIFEPVLTSPTAGGCSWLRTQ